MSGGGKPNPFKRREFILTCNIQQQLCHHIWGLAAARHCHLLVFFSVVLVLYTLFCVYFVMLSVCMQHVSTSEMNVSQLNFPLRLVGSFELCLLSHFKC